MHHHKFLAAKVKEARAEKPCCEDFLPSLADAVAKMEGLWSQIESTASDRARAHFEEIFRLKKAPKKAKQLSQVVLAKLKDSKTTPRPAVPSRWDMEEEVPFLSTLTKTVSETSFTSDSSPQLRHSASVAPETAASDLQPQPQTKAVSTPQTEPVAERTVSKPAAAAKPPKTPEMEAGKPHSARFPQNSQEIKAFIYQNKGSLTSLDLSILHSMATCYQSAPRSHSRFVFACPAATPPPLPKDTGDVGAIGAQSPRSRTILQKSRVVHSLITSFFTEEKELLRTERASELSADSNRYYRLFNQSYTFERWT